MMRHFLGSLLPRKRRRYWWALVRKVLATEERLSQLAEVMAKFEAEVSKGTVDDFLLPITAGPVRAMLASYTPTTQRFIDLHKRMQPETLLKHEELRRLLGIPGIKDEGGQRFSASLHKSVFNALCARERDLLDVWFLIQELTPEQFAVARKKIAERRKTWTQLSPLPKHVHQPKYTRFFIETQNSLERWPISTEMSTLNRNTNTFDTFIRRPHCGLEILAMNGWGALNELDLTGFTDRSITELLGQAMEVASVGRLLAAYVPLLQPALLRDGH